MVCNDAFCVQDKDVKSKVVQEALKIPAPPTRPEPSFAVINEQKMVATSEWVVTSITGHPGRLTDVDDDV